MYVYIDYIYMCVYIYIINVCIVYFIIFISFNFAIHSGVYVYIILSFIV